MSQHCRALDLAYARQLSEGRTGDASATMLRGLAPRWVGSLLAPPVGALVGRLGVGERHPDFARDVLVEADAEAACDARDVLPRIAVPVLLVCGDRDVCFPEARCRETARLISDCTLRMYAGKGHMRVASGVQVAREVLDFVQREVRR